MISKTKILILSCVCVILLILVGGRLIYLNLSILRALYTEYLSKSCSYSHEKECSKDEYCIFVLPQKSKCVKKDKEDAPFIPFPITSPVVCTQGPRTKEGRSHSYINTAYAVDLSTPKNLPNAKIRSVYDGVAVVNTGCDNKDEIELNNDYCGSGFGNWVLLFDNKLKYITLYAHFRSINIKNMQKVSFGTIIGEEGKTGAAGHRHLHFSIHRNIWNLKPEKFKKENMLLPPSIPFFTYKKNKSGLSIKTLVNDLQCSDNDLSYEPFLGN